MQVNKEIEEVERGKFKILTSTEYYTGTVDMASRGNAYIICDDLEDDIFIASNNMKKHFMGIPLNYMFINEEKRETRRRNYSNY